jgi:hypothetical protein
LFRSEEGNAGIPGKIDVGGRAILRTTGRLPTKKAFFKSFTISISEQGIFSEDNYTICNLTVVRESFPDIS